MQRRDKLRTGEIDWTVIERGCRDMPLDEGGTVNIDIKRARRQVAEATPYILTDSFIERVALIGKEVSLADVKDWPMSPPEVAGPVIYQINTPGEGRSDCTFLLIQGDSMIMLPLNTGGASFYSEMPRGPGETPKFHLLIPEAFRSEHTNEEDVQRYGLVMAVLARLATRMLREPEYLRTEIRPAKRTVSKGRSVRIPEHRVVTLYPGAEHVVRQRIQAERIECQKRATPAQHEVEGHWVTRRLAPDCLHFFEDTTTEEVAKRERCVVCGGIRTFRRGFKRGDPSRQPLPKVHVIR